MRGKKITLERDLYEQAKTYSDIAGYSSVDEFVAHALEKEMASSSEDESEEKVKERLRGLGYIS